RNAANGSPGRRRAHWRASTWSNSTSATTPPKRSRPGGASARTVRAAGWASTNASTARCSRIPSPSRRARRSSALPCTQSPARCPSRCTGSGPPSARWASQFMDAASVVGRSGGPIMAERPVEPDRARPGVARRVPSPRSRLPRLRGGRPTLDPDVKRTLSLSLATVLAACGARHEEHPITDVRTTDRTMRLDVSDSERCGLRDPSAPTDAGAQREQRLEFELPDGWERVPRGSMREVDLRAPGGVAVWVTRLRGDGGGEVPNLNRWRAEMGLERAGQGEFDALPTITLLGGEGRLFDAASAD